MKNKVINILFLGFFLIIFFSKNSYTKNFEFFADELKVLKEGNLLIGNDNVKILSEGQEIEADKFEYNKTNLHLKLLGNVKIVDTLKNTIMNGNKIDYFEKQNKFFAEDKVRIKIKDKYTIDSSDLTYLKAEEYFFSEKKKYF